MRLCSSTGGLSSSRSSPPSLQVLPRPPGTYLTSRLRELILGENSVCPSQSDPPGRLHHHCKCS